MVGFGQGRCTGCVCVTGAQAFGTGFYPSTGSGAGSAMGVLLGWGLAGAGVPVMAALSAFGSEVLGFTPVPEVGLAVLWGVLLGWGLGGAGVPVVSALPAVGSGVPGFTPGPGLPSQTSGASMVGAGASCEPRIGDVGNFLLLPKIVILSLIDLSSGSNFAGGAKHGYGGDGDGGK